MSIQSEARRTTAPEIRARKGGTPIVSLTSYHSHTAQLLDAHVDVILVGDSLGMVMHGLETTVPVTVEMMIVHGRAVVRGTKRALIVVDLPFGSYEASPVEAFHTAARVLKETGAGAVKLEGGVRMAETVRFLVDRGIPVMATWVSPRRPSTRSAPSRRASGRDRGRADLRGCGGDLPCGRLLHRAGGHRRAARPPHHAGGGPAHHRHRRQRGPATGRSSSWRTCWASRPACRSS